MHTRQILIYLALAYFIFPIFLLHTVSAQDIIVEDIKVENIKAKSGKAYKVGDDGLNVGTVYYIDRTYVVTTMPKEMEGATFIMTANDDKGSAGADFLIFTAKSPVLVWLAWDSRGDPVKGGQTPEWLSEEQGWVRHEDMIIEVTDTNMGFFLLWHKEFPGNEDIVLGGNADPPAAGQGSMYLVLLTAGKKLAVRSSGKLATQWSKLRSQIFSRE